MPPHPTVRSPNISQNDRPRFVQHRQHRGRASLQDLIFECQAFAIVLLEPFVRGDRIGKHLEMIGVAGMVFGIDVNPNGRHGPPADKDAVILPLPETASGRARSVGRGRRALTAFTVRPRSAAMSKTEALEMTSCRSRLSSSGVQAFVLLGVFV